MRWHKREMWKAGITLAGMLLLLVLMVWVPVSAAGVYERESRLATPGTGTVQAMPTEDATVTALNKEKLAQEVQLLKNQNEQLKEQNGLNLLGWLQMNTVLLSTFVVVCGGLFGLWRWRVDRRDAQLKELEDRKDQREKRAEERFQAVVEGLGSEREEAKIGAAITLRTFLRPGYEQFYIQAFDLAVAHLRLQRRSSSSEDSHTPWPPDSLGQALVMVFKEVFPLARDWLKEHDPQTQFHPQSLDAARIQLDYAYLREADLRQVWLHRASLRKANLFRANLSEARLKWADLSGVKLEEALSLKDADLRGVIGLTKEQLAACKVKGAIIDEDTTSPPQSPVSPPSPSQSTDAQAPSVPSAQVNTSTPDTDGSSTTSSKPSDGTQAPSAPSVQRNIPTPNTGESSAASSQPNSGA